MTRPPRPQRPARSPYAHTDRELLRLIERAPGGKAGYKQLIRELGLGGGRDRRLLVEQLTRIVARGELLRVDDDHWALPRRETTDNRRGPRDFSAVEATLRGGRDRLVSGRLDLHRDGFGFVRVELPKGEGSGDRPGDIFIAPNEINGAMQGDLVLVDELPPGRDGRRSGRIARVLTRRNPTIVGIFHYARPRRRADEFGILKGNFVAPLDERMGGPIAIADGAELPAAAPDSPHRMLGEEARHILAEIAPKDPRFPLEGLAVDVEITRFPSPGRPAEGRVLEVLGPPDGFGVDVEIVIRKHHIPHAFPPAVLAEANQRAAETVATLTPQELALREDFRGLPIITIDGQTARDFDDAVLVRELPNGHSELQVHIADVSHYVLAGSPLDTEARIRGNSVYFPDRAVPMLPHALSSGMCSLRPNEDRLVLSCIMEIDPAGEVVGYRLAEGILRSVRRMTYTSVQHCIDAVDPTKADSPNRAEDVAERLRVESENPGLTDALDRMFALALRLNAKRVRRGSIDFDLPEPIVQFDPEGNMKAIVRSERGWSHRLIEEFMLSANECVATWLERLGIPSIYRVHEMPDPKRIVEFEETAAGFGHSLGIGNLPVRKLTMKADRRDTQRRSARGNSSRAPQQHELPTSIPVTPQMYQKLVRRISGTAEERILAYLMLRSLKQARYAEQNEGHFALASPSYTHFTSPIRRYPDLIVHRLLRTMLWRGADPRGGAIRSTDPQPWKQDKTAQHGIARLPGATAAEPADIAQPEPISAEELSDIASECSQTERRAADAERELIEWKKMKFMADKVGDDFSAVVLSCTKYGFFVELDDLFIEGLVPMASLVDDHYTFRDTDRTIVGARTGHVFSLGQKVRVILDRIDRQQRRLQFALLPGTEPGAMSRGESGSLRSSRAAKPPKPTSSGYYVDQFGPNSKDAQRKSSKKAKKARRAAHATRQSKKNH
jgi:ribonuclease R